MHRAINTLMSVGDDHHLPCLRLFVRLCVPGRLFHNLLTGIPAKMKGPEVVAALRGILNTTSLNTLTPEDIQLSSKVCDHSNASLIPVHPCCIANCPSLLSQQVLVDHVN